VVIDNYKAGCRMNIFRKKNGFSTVELLTVIAILIVLASALMKIAKGVRTQAQDRLVSGQIDIIVTALELYYADQTPPHFPFTAAPTVPEEHPTSSGQDNDPSYGEAELELTIEAANGGDAVSFSAGTHRDEYSSSEAMFYFLDRSPDSSKIIDAMSSTLISNKDQSGNALEITIGTDTFDLVRFIDPWGNSLRYTYVDGNAFPLIESAGVDGKFYTSGDNITSR
jgi:type II secretory pathway pseudopilin PulG